MYGDDPEVITDWCVLSAESGHCFKRAGDHRFTRDGTSGCLCMLHHPCSSCIFVCSKDNGRNEPVKILQGMLPAIMFAFSSSSSVGTLPINMECVENMGASKEVSSFVLPLGATINMDGTAIYQGVCAIFIASCYGIHLTLPQMLTMILTATLASIGTAGVPGAGMVMLAMVLTSVGLPVDGIALVAGVDRIFDMGRTVVNITGDASCCIIVSNMERKKDAKREIENGL